MSGDIKLKAIPLRRICIHWTAGKYTQNNDDFVHYHYTYGHDGQVANGKFHPIANIPPLRNGFYAAHCGGGNSYTIGVALRGMMYYRSPNDMGKYPLTAVQCEAAWAHIAKLCKEHGIIVNENTVYTHYEFGKKNPDSDSQGKIDINFLPHRPELQPHEIGGYIRAKVCWYLAKLEKESGK